MRMCKCDVDTIYKAVKEAVEFYGEVYFDAAKNIGFHTFDADWKAIKDSAKTYAALRHLEGKFGKVSRASVGLESGRVLDVE